MQRARAGPRRDDRRSLDLTQTLLWPYLPTLKRLALALVLGLFVGLERERRGKEAGLRTFGFVALIGALGGLLGGPYGVVSILAVVVLTILLNVQTLRAAQGTELTTSAAMIVTVFVGLLAGLGHTLTPAALVVASAGLLAWKEHMAGFSQALTETELRSAILLAILAFVVYPALPPGSLDRWGLIEPRAAWFTVLLIAAMGFVNYILLKLYGARGVELTGFLGGLVNSTVTVTELADRDRESSGHLADFTYRGVVLATGAMVVRNAVLLFLLAPAALLQSALAFLLMLIAAGTMILLRRNKGGAPGRAPELSLASPFAIQSALKFGLIFLTLQVAGTLAQRLLGKVGFYAISLVGGLVSSASAVAAAATLNAQGKLPSDVAGIGAVIAAVASALVNLPLVARISADRPLSRRLAWPLGTVALVGITGIVLQWLLAHTAVGSALRGLVSTLADVAPSP
jgi:uncharacterized membrane protein (DUF4010 family)